MSRKQAFGAGFLGGFVVARHNQAQRAAVEAAQVEAQAAWEQAYAQAEHDQQVAAEAAAVAARDEARRQGEIAGREVWMRQDPVGRAWREARAPGAADVAMAERVKETNVAWRRAWAQQCAQDGLAPVETRAVRGWTMWRVLVTTVPMLLGLAGVLFAASTLLWLYNHSWATPVEVNLPSRDGRAEPLRGTRTFWTSGLAYAAAYASLVAAVVAWVSSYLLDARRSRALAAARDEAKSTNVALGQRRVERYGFDPLAKALPIEAHWAVLPDGTDPEAAHALMAVADPRRMQHWATMDMAHVRRLEAVAQWGGQIRADTPPMLPPEMIAALERMRG